MFPLQSPLRVVKKKKTRSNIKDSKRPTDQGEYSYVEFSVDTITNQHVATKVIFDKEIAEAELQITLRLQGQSEHIIKLLSTYISYDGNRVLVFPRLKEIFIEEFTTLNGMKTFLLQIIEALSVMHKFSIVHRDIHFNNILQSYEDGKLILIDYGCSKYSDKLHRDYTNLGKCFLELLRIHLHLKRFSGDITIDDKLKILEENSIGNKKLLEACDIAKSMINCQSSSTIDLVKTHVFLQEHVTTKYMKERKPLTDISNSSIIL